MVWANPSLKLLVSVTSLHEALVAAVGGCDIIDIKNPEEGALGANLPWVLREIREEVDSGREVSATLGDLPYLPGTASLAAVGAASLGMDYVKAGLFGPRSPSEAQHLLTCISRSVKECSPRVGVIAAGYADYSRYGCIDPLILPSLAHRAGAAGVMIDVKEKGERKLFHYLSLGQLASFTQEAHSYGLLVALAGHLGVEDIPIVRRLDADIMGVRRAVCRRDGEGRLHVDQRLVEELVQRLPHH